MLDQLQNVFASFQKNDVRYLVIGGIAAVLYGVPRATFDLDVLIEPSAENVERLLKAMTEAGLGTAALTSVNDVLSTDHNLHRPVATRRPDVYTGRRLQRGVGPPRDDELQRPNAGGDFAQ